MVLKKELKKKSEIYDSQPASSDEELYLAKLSKDLNKINDDYISYAEGHDVSEPEQVSQMQKARYAMMLRACMRPISGGCSRGGIVQSIGMFAGMCLMDKEFANRIKGGVAGFLLPYVEAKVGESGKDSFWSRFADKLKSLQPGEPLPLEPETVALTKFAYIKRAYNDMRQPGADINKVNETYNKAVSRLYENAEKNGIKAKDIDSSLLYVVGKMAEHDPSVLKYFAQTSNGRVMMDDYKLVEQPTMGDDGKPTTYYKYQWSGKFKTASGEEFNGALDVRRPATASEFSKDYSRFVGDTVKDALSKYPSSKLNDAQSAVVNELHQAQSERYTSINKGFKEGKFSKNDVQKMRDGVASLDSVKFGYDDLSKESLNSISYAISESYDKYSHSGSWNLKYDDVYEEMMKDDGLQSHEIEQIYQFAKDDGLKGAFADYSNFTINNAKRAVRAETLDENFEQQDFSREYSSEKNEEPSNLKSNESNENVLEAAQGNTDIPSSLVNNQPDSHDNVKKNADKASSQYHSGENNINSESDAERKTVLDKYENQDVNELLYLYFKTSNSDNKDLREEIRMVLDARLNSSDNNGNNNDSNNNQNVDKEEANLLPGSAELKEKERDSHSHARPLAEGKMDKYFDEVFQGKDNNVFSNQPNSYASSKTIAMPNNVIEVSIPANKNVLLKKQSELQQSTSNRSPMQPAVASHDTDTSNDYSYS